MRLRHLTFQIILVSLFASCCLASAQERPAEIAGRAIWRQELKDSDGKVLMSFDMPVAPVHATLIMADDTLHTTGDSAGSFKFFNLRSGPVHLMLEAEGHESFSEGFELVPGENIVLVEMKQVKPEKDPEVLDAAVVEAEVPLMTMKGDTLVYNAAAMAIQQGDYAIDLLRQMPGVEVRNRQIIVSGKQVRRTYVNGALIFGLDPMAGMENLVGEQVTQFYVYDEDNPQDRLDGRKREKERVINIHTKDPIFSVTDLQARAIAGADQERSEDGSPLWRYAVGVNGKYFSELRQLRTDVVTGNLGMTSSLISNVPQVQSQYHVNSAAHLGYDRFWQSPLYGNGMQMSYDYGRDRTKGRRRALTEYFETAGIPARSIESQTSDETLLDSHRINAVFSYRTNPKLRITWRNAVSLSERTRQWTDSGGTTTTGKPAMLRDEHGQESLASWSIDEALNVSFQAGKLHPVINIGFQAGKDDSGSRRLDTLASSYTRRILTRDGNTSSRALNASLSHQLALLNNDFCNMILSGEYSFNSSRRSEVQEAYDLFGAPAPVANPANTYDFTYSDIRHSLGFNGSMSFKKGKRGMVRFSLAAVSDQVSDEERIPAQDPLHRTFYSLRPSLMYVQGGFTFQYNMTSGLPSLQQLRGWIDDSNPLFLRSGNPDLNSSRTHTVSVQVGSVGNSSLQRVLGSNRTLSALASLSYTANPFVSRTDYFAAATELPAFNYTVPGGASLMTWEQAGHMLTASARLSIQDRPSWFGGKWKPLLGLIPTLNYTQRPEYYGGVLDQTSEWTPGLQASGSVIITNRYSLGLRADGSYTHVSNEGGSLNMDAIRFSLGANAEVRFFKIGFMRADYSWNQSRNLTRDSMDMDVHRLGATLGLALMGRSMEISLMGLDLLHGGSLYTASFGASSYTQSWTPVYGRCFLLNVSWRFNSSGGSKIFPTVSL